MFSDRDAFDGAHGGIAYNRTERDQGKSTVCLPMGERIIAVERHSGLIASTARRARSR